MTIYKYPIAHRVPLYRMDKNGQTERPSHNEIISIGQKLTKKALADAKAFIIIGRLLANNTN